MKNDLLTIKELATITQLSESTLRTYLGNYKFNKFIISTIQDGKRRKKYNVEQEFLDIFADFLWLKRQIKAKKKLENYFKNKEVSDND